MTGASADVILLTAAGVAVYAIAALASIWLVTRPGRKGGRR